MKWLTEFDERVRFRLYAAYDQSYMSGHYGTSNLVNNALGSFVSDQSQMRLSHSSADGAFRNEVEPSSTDELLDWLAAIPIVLERFAAEYNGTQSDEEYGFTHNLNPKRFAGLANDVLLEARIGYTFINNRLKPRSDEPLFLAVVEPVEALLTSNSRFAAVETAYQQAQSSIASGQYGAAITSAGSALQTTLEALGASGSNLGALFANARSRGFLMGHDAKLLESYKSLVDWATADRSNRGTAHGAATAQRADADMTLHVVAALIIRLIKHAELQEYTAAPKSVPNVE
ncbi:hypothetical protein GY21_08515 [Cryobacterium roopkundense]|uniref:Abortive infection protein-like C-terminal domain-containing protein n=1 Tax=Cryobacterium roopkundense TaxID=1001240 RepID=A0A099JFF7_9MICO|nr:hypothetical protein GY21_08515 [Cryobacterium roopkundense]